MNTSLICGECGKTCSSTVRITKQTVEGFSLINVCEDCKNKHDNFLEKLRENFKVQFGEK